MDSIDHSMLGDEEMTFEALLRNNFRENLDFEQELVENVEDFEKEIFGSQNYEGNIFDVVGGEDAENLLKAIDKIDKEGGEFENFWPT